MSLPTDIPPLAFERAVPPSADAHHQLGEYHAYAALAGLAGAEVAEAETGASLAVHAARLAAVLGELLAENAGLRVIIGHGL
jgi:hypothetical protein